MPLINSVASKMVQQIAASCTNNTSAGFQFQKLAVICFQSGFAKTIFRFFVFLFRASTNLTEQISRRFQEGFQ